MKIKRTLLLATAPMLLTVLLAPTAMSKDVPPEGSKSLSGILKSIESDDAVVITDAEFDDGVWKIKTHQAGKREILYFDPNSGEQKMQASDDGKDEMPPAKALKLSKIVKSVEDEKQGVITEVEFDDGYWEFELDVNGKEMDFDVDPMTGKRRK